MPYAFASSHEMCASLAQQTRRRPICFETASKTMNLVMKGAVKTCGRRWIDGSKEVAAPRWTFLRTIKALDCSSLLDQVFLIPITPRSSPLH